MEAWVTSAVEDKVVNKAIVLAGSLRRVRTAKKLAVLTALTVSKELREKLKEVFDLVLLLEQDSPNGLNLEDYAKVQGFSLLIFNKCVYLSPNALVLKNCDEIFRKYTTFAATTNNGNDFDPSVYLYAPSLEYSRALGKVAHYVGDKTGDFSKCFNAWLKNHIPHIETLDEQYNLKLSLKGKVHQSLDKNPFIANFCDVHPLDFPEKFMNEKEHEFGVIEKYAASRCRSIYMEEIKSKVMMNSLTSFTTGSPEPVAIIGMSFRLPGGNNVDEFWNLLEEGREAIRPVPSNRWTKDQSYFTCKDRKVEAGFLNVPINEMDAKFFGISPKEAEFLDPQQRLLHELTWEAFEDAMIDPLKLRGTQTGVFVGSWIHDYKDICLRAPDVDFFRVYMGNSIASTAARLSHFLETTGPSIATESGCSSAIAAVDMACKSLRSGDSDLGIVCGVNLLLHPFDQNLLEFVLSPDFRCKTFDAGANGFARAEACAVLLMKRLSDAVRDGDDIWGLVRGSALVQEGVSKSLGTPTIHCESLAMELALKDAGVHPKDVSYIEAHGTGTPVGDPMEVAAIAKAYSRGRNEPLLIGSVKSNVGHTEAASGLTGIIKVLLSMKNEILPKHLNLETLNPNINLDMIPAQIPTTQVPWPRLKDKPRIAGVSSFGISGTDGHAIIEEPPHPTHNNFIEFAQERPLHIIKFSAKCAESMEKLLQNYQQILKEGDKDFADIAHSANIGRSTFNHRAVVVARNCTEAVKILEEKSFKQSDVQSCSSPLCFLFTGQGSQYPNMAKQLYTTSPIFKDSFDKCDDVLQEQYQISMKKILWPEGGNDGHDQLSRTLYSQTSIFVVEYCLLKLWESWGVQPDFVMGHSLGEFAAAVAAGALNFEDAIMLVAERSRLIDDLPRGKMLVIKADKKTVDNAIHEFKQTHPNFWVDYAALNSPDQTVVAGDSGMIEDFSKFCGEKSLKTIVLAATHAFHSRHMEPMLDNYRKVAATVKKPDKVKENLPKYISGMEGKIVEIDSIDAEYWVRHTREKVSFMEACQVAQQEGCTIFLEVGPHPVLSALAMMNIEGQPITCLPSIRRKEEEWTTMLDSLSKLYLSDWKGEVDWKGFDRFYTRSRVKLPFYPFNRKVIWSKTDPIRPNIHPLIGKVVPTASSETVYQSALTLKNASFTQDHVIGNTVVFPGAGFLEMCLAGGHSTVQGFSEDMLKPRRPIVLKSLKIASPLALYESGVCRLQTVITLSDKQDDGELGYSVSVHRQVEAEDGQGGVDQWIQHASAKFLPVAPSISKDLSEPIDIATIQSTCEKSDNKDFYEKLPEVGLRFGPKFQSLECGWKTEKGILASVKVPQDQNDYLVHPVVADAMIQAVMIWTSKEKLKKKLQVPVQIGEFIWLTSVESSARFVYCSTNEVGRAYCLLLDEQGIPLAYMADVDFIETTAKLVEGMIQQQSAAMPKLWEDVWKNISGPMQGALHFNISNVDKYTNQPEDVEFYKQKNDIGEDEVRFHKYLQNLSRFHVLKTLYELGWKPEMGQQFTTESVTELLKIKENFKQFIRFFFRSMAKEEFGLLKINDLEENTFQFSCSPPQLKEVETRIRAHENSKDFTREEFKLIQALGKDLGGIFLGKVHALAVLFPEGSEKPSAAKFYDAIRPWMNDAIQRTYNSCNIKLLDDAAAEYFKASTTSQFKPVLRILEVGAGTGVYSKIFLEEYTKVERSYDLEYYFTDVTAAFFNSAEKALEKHGKSIIYKKFDMEKDPLEQGFCPGYFDTILACEVLHVSKNIKNTLKNLRSLMKPGGSIQIVETVYPDEKITFCFGLLDGYWQFQDRDFRKNHTTLTPKMWEEAFLETGYVKPDVILGYNGNHGIIAAYASPDVKNLLVNLHPQKNSWLIFSDTNDQFAEEVCKKIQGVNRICSVVPRPKSEDYTEDEMTDYLQAQLNDDDEEEGGRRIEGIIYMWSLSTTTRNQTKVSLPFVTLMKLIFKKKFPPRTYVVTRGAAPIESSEVIDPSSATLIGFCRSLSNENVSLNINYVDLDPLLNTLDQVDELFTNLWVELRQGIAFRDGLRLCPRLTSAKILTNEPLSLPSGCDRFQLVLPKTRVISDLEFAYLEPYTLEENEVEVEVKAMALNFRDVFTVLKPIPLFERFNSVGLDLSGVITKVGDKVTKLKVGQRVIGMNMYDCLSLPSHIKLDDKKLVPLKDDMTFAEGVTLPAVFSTAVYCLINIAKMKKGETVLIHTASGGVGLVAIQLCKYIGANVIATAGSRRKRNFLRNLGIQHVFHSRTTDFGQQILEVTNGRGVDIVLNSITGPGFKEASMDALTKGGRFIEMSKLNTWSEEEVCALRPDVFYQVVDLTTLESSEYNELIEELRKFLDTDFIKPIPYERFDALNVRGALNYLQKAKHIGKIVCIMPQIKMEKSKLIVSTPLLNEESTYLVTGGLGGIGWEVVKWMLNNGAKHVAIASRSSPNPEIAVQIETWNKAGKHVQAFAVDVGNYQKCKELLEQLKMPELGFPRLRGVMHAAGVLQDSTLENQTWDKFLQTYNPKVNGSWNLHDLTKDYLLEHFVLFSSIAATFGSPGQTNHSASNCFEDALALYRRSNGLPATCVNWGNWGEVGVATEIDFPGIRPISTSQGLLALETFLKTQSSHLAVLNVDAFSLLMKIMPQLKHYVDDCRLLGEVKGTLLINSDEFWNEVDSAPDREGKIVVFKNFIKTVVRNILKMDRDEKIDNQAEFQSLGIDSLMMLEMKNGLQNILGVRMVLSASQLKDCTNTEILASTLVDILEGEHDSEKNLPTLEELKQLVRDDSNLLPETLSIENLKRKSVTEIETVLLTGATGNLGPYLLRDLTHRCNIKKVYCLVRKSGKLSGEERLKARLEHMQILDTIELNKVEVVEGDVTSPTFDLSEEAYARLSEDVDAVVHSAVRADHNAKYWKAPNTRKNNIRTVNVLGTLHALQFAATKVVKQFYLASTMFTFVGVGENDSYSEGWQDVGAFDSVSYNVGYVLSKHISEQLVLRAIRLGIPCKAFRFPHISGDSKTGRLDYQNNHITLRWLTCMKIGAVHDLPSPISMIAPDHCAKITLDIFLHPEAPIDVYNVVQKHLEVEQVLIEVAESFGVSLDIVSHTEFLERLRKEDDKSPIAAFVKLYEEGQSEFLDNFENPTNTALKKYLEDSTNLLDTSNLTKYSPAYENLIESNSQVMIRDLTYLKNQGVFEKFGIKTT